MEELLFLQTLLHYKAQHLAVLNNSFLPIREDDSQSNLGWDTKREALVSRVLPNGAYLELNYKTFALQYYGANVKSKLPLAGRKDADITLWIKEQLVSDGLDIDNYPAKVGYKLANFEAQIEKWTPKLKAKSKQLATWRTIAQKASERIGPFYSNHSEIRVWPHHFDTGMLIDLGGNFEKGVAIGYATKGTVNNVPYYYAYAWTDQTIDYSSLPALKLGQWKTGDWKGAITPVREDLTEEEVFQFYLEVTNAFVERV